MLPPVPGLAERWGNGVVHCPYCHGWERRGVALAVLALDEQGVYQAVHLRGFSEDVALCTNAAVTPTEDQRELLRARGVGVFKQPISRLEGEGTGLERIVFDDGTALARTALFCYAPTRQRSALPAQLGCALLDDRSVGVNDFGQTSVPGVFAAGDMTRRPSMPVPGAQVVIAAAEGIVAAVVIDQELVYARRGGDRHDPHHRPVRRATVAAARARVRRRRVQVAGRSLLIGKQSRSVPVSAACRSSMSG